MLLVGTFEIFKPQKSADGRERISSSVTSKRTFPVISAAQFGDHIIIIIVFESINIV